MSTDEQPGAGVSTDSLEVAQHVLTEHSDIIFEEEGHIPAWVTAARRAVQAELRRRDHD